MKVLVTGAKGQLGYDVIGRLNELSIACIGADIDDFDITNLEKARTFIKDYQPDVIVHCSAYTAVDRAESEIEICNLVNIEGTRNMALIAKEINAKMVYISTDYVFPGEGENFYEVDDATGPTNVYGKSKLEGELAVKDLIDNYFILRISWVFGKNGNNFVKTMLKIGSQNSSINVVGDQFGSPTFTEDVAILICDMIVTEKYGTYHVTNEGICSWAEFAQEIFNLSGYDVLVNPILSEEYPTKAMRPKNSRLSKEKLKEAGFNNLPTWQDALSRYLRK